MSTDIDLTDPGRTCRTCAKMCNLVNMQPIFKEGELFSSHHYLAEYLLNHLKITYLDELPQSICPDCHEFIKRIEDFLKQCENSRDTLQQILKKEHITLAKPDIEFMSVEKFEYVDPENVADQEVYSNSNYCESVMKNKEKSFKSRQQPVAVVLRKSKRNIEPIDQVNSNENSDEEDFGDFNDDFQNDSDYEPEESVKVVKRWRTKPVVEKTRTSKRHRSVAEEMLKPRKSKDEPRKSKRHEVVEFKESKEPNAAVVQEAIKEENEGKEDKAVLNNMKCNEAKDAKECNLECKICLDKFDDQDEFQKHLSVKHINTEEDGEVCTKEVEDTEDVKSNCSSESFNTVCPTCKEDLLTEVNLVEHIRTAHSSQTCPICERTFFNVGSRNKHVETHNKCNNYKCDVCPKAFKSKTNLYKHMKNMHGKSKHECPDCGAQFNDDNKYNNHLRTHDKNIKYVCKTCGKSFTHPHRLKTHEHLHTGLKPFLCNECGAGFATRGNLKGHIIQVHSGERRYKCNICEKAFAWRRTYIMHMQAHEGSIPRPFICEHCGKDFPVKGALKNHLRTHTGEKPFKCDACEMAFAQKGQLTSHKSFIHGGPPKVKGMVLPKPLEVVPPPPVFIEKINEDTASQKSTAIKNLPFICTVCNKGFRLPLSLTRHFKQWHTEARAFPCTMCPLSFKAKNILNTHVKAVHLKLRPHVCQVCTKSFTQSTTLNIHMRSHTGEKPFACTVCNKTFGLLQRLKVHMRTHTGERLFKCEICTEDFKTYKVLSYHMRTKHKNWASCSTNDLQENLIEAGSSSDNNYSTL